ncbi:cysteine--tRNA ligase [Bradyrhizobium sp. AUGA SZCCT0222]|uniref:cysteine--tRNA ligase n=1 Tax=Bradyrhizobium sp. AUGA SZCCT0222 TaxID=2807668 RepID=UPI001BA80173|nr:cysteine--tRNA ligase [Bradyrhizobium sp. AUGA SZCCT0222]MBR1271213.1 cysteine--tRNA ligase [Bradyrhizobium sp. AUGA SZCCT0222]
MSLRLYDTLTKEKRPFTPLDATNVGMYVCGPTVYDFAHIGNARPIIVFDVLFRLLRHLYGDAHVKYVRNITDVDDKINDRAARDFPSLPLNDAIRKVTELTEKQFHDDVDALAALRPTVEPRATEHIAEMREIIEKLVQAGFAYVAEDHVLFSPQAMNAANSVLPRYGALANRSLDEMIAGARVDVAPYKRDTTDFVLWKPAKLGEPSWPSPAGIAAPGRPGWHIECSAMAWKHLGEKFDIHGGGIDLVFPHHENELAQSCCAFHAPRMASVWMHNGFLQVEGEKMSKSLGNFVTIRELLNSWTGAVMRYAMLQTHYRQPIDWTVSRLEQARQEMGSWAAMYSGSEAHHDYQQRKFRKVAPQPTQDLVDALEDDLNTPNGVAVLRKQFSPAAGLTKEFFQNCEFLGLLNGENIGALEDTHVLGTNVQPRLLFDAIPYVMNFRVGTANNIPEVIQRAESDLAAIGIKAVIRRDAYVDIVPLDKSSELDSATIDALIADRTAARARKDFKESDRIRDQLAAMKVVLKDSKDADGNPITTWEVSR